MRDVDRIRTYHDLLVWRKAMDLVCTVYGLAAALPATERFGLGAQLRRSVVSVAANIAEGHGRGNPGDFARHLSIARGSLKEMETHALIAARLGFVARETVGAMLGQSNEVSRMLAGLAARIRRRRSA